MSRSRHTRFVALVLLSFQASGCYVWRDVRAAHPDAYFLDHSPKHVRLTVTHGEPGVEAPAPLWIELLHPRVSGDSIRGPLALHRARGPARLQPGDTVSVACSAVRRVEVRRFEPVRTTLALGLVGGLVGLTVAEFISLANWSGPLR